MSSRILRGSLFVLAGGLLMCTPLEAGSVFLKNGYIIQGRVVERDNDYVVLGWTNGKMTIYRRFIDEVILDPTEEMDLKRAANPQAPTMTGGSALEYDLDLPERLEDVIAIHSGPLTVEDTIPDPDLTSDPPAVDPTPRPIPLKIPLPPVALPEEKEFPEMGVVLSVPPGWHVDQSGTSIRLRKSPDEAFPSLTVRSIEGSLDREIAQNVLRETLEAEFTGLRVTAERTEQIGFERALVLEGEYPETDLFFSQVLIWHGDRHYLVGLQAPLPVNDDDLMTLQRTLHSLRFSR